MFLSSILNISPRPLLIQQYWLLTSACVVLDPQCSGLGHSCMLRRITISCESINFPNLCWKRHLLSPVTTAHVLFSPNTVFLSFVNGGGNVTVGGHLLQEDWERNISSYASSLYGGSRTQSWSDSVEKKVKINKINKKTMGEEHYGISGVFTTYIIYILAVTAVHGTY